MTRRTAPLALILAAPLALGTLALGCNQSTPAAHGSQKQPGATGSDKQPQATGSDKQPQAGSGRQPGAVGMPVHLGNKMYELQRRWSAMWFAGQAGNAKMAKYQAHEIEELVEDMTYARPVEEGVDVVDRLNQHVIARLEGIEEAVAKGDKEAFETAYKVVTAGCNGCHVETKHEFIKVQQPEYNPYPNLKFDP